MEPRVGAERTGLDAPTHNVPLRRERGLRLHRVRWAVIALTATLAVSAAFVLWEGRHMTFFQDEWDLILHRPGHSPAILLRASNGHLVLVPLLIYKVLLALFGASYTPFRAANVAAALLCAVLVFVLVRRRVGEGPALAAAVLLLFLGAAWEDLVWALGITYYGAVAAGLGMLLALERGDRRGDLAACVLLMVSIATVSIGLAFAVGATVEVCLDRRPRGWRRLWISLVPLLLYGLWTIGYGQSQLIESDIVGVPYYLAETASAALASLTGTFRNAGSLPHPFPVTAFPPFSVDYGRPLAVVGALALLLNLRRWPRCSPRLWALLAGTLTLWLSFALVAGQGRSPYASRYQYPDVLLVILIVAEMMRGARLTARGGAIVGGLLALSLLANLAQLNDGASLLGGISTIDRAELAGLEIARGIVAPEFRAETGSYPPPAGHLHRVDAGTYFAFIAMFGSPADRPGQLVGAPEIARESADSLIARAERLSLVPVSGAVSYGVRLKVKADAHGRTLGHRSACLAVRPGSSDDALVVDVPPEGLWLEASARAIGTVKLRRFSDAYSAIIGTISPGQTVELTTPRDGSARPWEALVTTTRSVVTVCGR